MESDKNLKLSQDAKTDVKNSFTNISHDFFNLNERN